MGALVGAVLVLDAATSNAEALVPALVIYVASIVSGIARWAAAPEPSQAHRTARFVAPCQQ